MHKLIFHAHALGLIFGSSLVSAQVFLPPVNLGSTSFLDGVGGPGVLLQETFSFYSSDTIADSDGHVLPVPGEIESIASTLLIARLTERKVLGGYYGYEVLVPVVKLDIFGMRETGIGDIGVSPFMIQWVDSRLFGRPYLHRLNFFFNLPTGGYDSGNAVNIGSNTLSFNPYYAATLQVSERIEVSTRAHYLWSGENDSPNLLEGVESTQSGQAFHINLSGSYSMGENFRFGVSAYMLEQLNDHKINGRDLANSKERVFAIGPALGYYNGKFTINFNAYFESGAENRPEGSRYHLRIAKVL